MKIRPEHYAHMKQAIAAVADQIPDMRVRIANDPRVKYRNFEWNAFVHHAERRLRWDLSYKAGLTQYICDNVYPYANDTHLDTALRSIMREIAAD